MKKKVLLLATGGTISTVYRPEIGGLAAGLSGKDIAAQAVLPLDLQVEDFARINSTYMKPDDMLRLSLRVREVIENGTVDGIVITHGTSTLEETAFFLDTTIGGDIPVVLTGAQRAATEPWPDGPANLNDALRVAADDRSRKKGVLVVFAGEIHAAREVRKVHTSGLRAFGSGDAGSLGHVYSDEVHFVREPVRADSIAVKRIDTRVDLIKFAAGMDDRYIQASIGKGASGIVIEGVGLGNVNEEFYRGIKKAREKGIVVVMVSRSENGRVIPKYGYLGGGSTLVREGVIFGGSLSGPKARLLLMVCLGAGMGRDEMEEVFAAY